MHRGERIQEEMVRKSLGISPNDFNPNLPILVDNDTEQIEHELMLKQLLFLRQDVNEIKQMMFKGKIEPSDAIQPSNSALYLPPTKPCPEVHEIPVDGHRDIEDGKAISIYDDAIGEATMSDLEHEMIERTLIHFNHNRRKTAKSLDISERTLYRKIQEYKIQKDEEGNN